MCVLRFTHKGHNTADKCMSSATEEGTAARLAFMRVYVSWDDVASTGPTLIPIVTVEGWSVLVTVLVVLV